MVALTFEIAQGHSEEEIEYDNESNQSTYTDPIPFCLSRQATVFQHLNSKIFCGSISILKKEEKKKTKL